ncbi:hypothetical protein F4810DRAFT_314295 [Camillea tinctor]|nr:hypothetical protein F4810DRAFT_314295 [Camillea tinctor]
MAPIQIPPRSRGDDASIVIGGVCIALAILFTALRFYTRVFTKAGLGSDDWFIFTAVIINTIGSCLILYGNIINPNGPQVSENTDPDYVYTPEDLLFLRLVMATCVLYFTVGGATRLGILLMYHRIFSVSTTFWYQVFVASAFNVAWWIGCTINSLVHFDQYNGNVFDYRTGNLSWMVSGACEVFLDALILTLPISIVMWMHLSFRQKLTVVGIFLLGGFTIITGIIKVVVGYNRSGGPPTYANTVVWASIHASMIIICASLPIFRPLVRRIAGSSIIIKLMSCLITDRKAESCHSLSPLDPKGENQVGYGNGENI